MQQKWFLGVFDATYLCLQLSFLLSSSHSLTSMHTYLYTLHVLLVAPSTTNFISPHRAACVVFTFFIGTLKSISSLILFLFSTAQFKQYLMWIMYKYIYMYEIIETSTFIVYVYDLVWFTSAKLEAIYSYTSGNHINSFYV